MLFMKKDLEHLIDKPFDELPKEAINMFIQGLNLIKQKIALISMQAINFIHN